MAFKPLTANDTQDMYTFILAANNYSDGILMPFVLGIIFFTSLLGMVFSGRPFHRALTYSGFICVFFGIFLALMNMLNTNYIYLCILITGIGLVWTKLAEGQS